MKMKLSACQHDLPALRGLTIGRSLLCVKTKFSGARKTPHLRAKTCSFANSLLDPKRPFG
jgi:hypothetical protein